MTWFQTTINLQPRSRGFHLVTNEIVQAAPEIGRYTVGVAHLFIKHTSASLAVNESYDPDVRADMLAWFNRAAPENEPYYVHTLEGADDMPSHIKSVLTGSELTLPLTDGRFNLGMWQGIWLCEHRNHGGARQIILTLNGESG